ncbi:hypothetical protein EJ02DRAFT_456581, partial [Clathrospora elynae]
MWCCSSLFQHPIQKNSQPTFTRAKDLSQLRKETSSFCFGRPGSPPSRKKQLGSLLKQ